MLVFTKGDEPKTTRIRFRICFFRRLFNCVFYGLDCCFGGFGFILLFYCGYGVHYIFSRTCLYQSPKKAVRNMMNNSAPI